MENGRCSPRLLHELIHLPPEIPPGLPSPTPGACWTLLTPSLLGASSFVIWQPHHKPPWDQSGSRRRFQGWAARPVLGGFGDA